MDLDAPRHRIDEIDHHIVELLNERANLALQVGAIKAQEGRSVHDPQRENQVYANLETANRGPLGNDALRAIYREVIATMSELQRPRTVAFLGPPATFSHEAARLHFGTTARFIPAKTIAEVFAMAEKGTADQGLVPVENSTDGVVGHTLDLLADTELKICAEIPLPISHHLLSCGSLDAIRRVYSHPQALAQCRNWLGSNLPNAELIEVSSTARAAEMVVSDPTAAAISNELAAEVYGLAILQRRIEDNPFNYTRFLVIGNSMCARTGDDRTAVVFSIKDRVGALHDTLEIFLRYGVNLTRIESRPSRRKAWDYVFFVDAIGHPEDPSLEAALSDLAKECVYVRVLGSWPKAYAGK
ncbi:MAG: prephenate dehydratase [Chloroflexi bacterium]|nr:prephenate dehydratase [Chloroflexota bacterium]